MQLTLKQLNVHLSKSLLPIYCISGDEPLLIQEAREAVFQAAKLRGFTEKDLCHVDSTFRHDTLAGLIHNHSLFSEKKIIDIRNASAKWDSNTQDLLQAYLAQPSNDRVIVISTEKLTPAAQKAAWCENIKKIGAFLPIWPVATHELPAWIMERAKRNGLMMPLDAARMLAHYSEGNLLSAQQAIEKCAVNFPSSEITRDALITVLSDHARFNIFDLSDALASNHPKKIIRILHRLEQTGEEPALVLWAICRKLRENSASDQVKKALQQASTVDEMIKGATIGNPWEAMMRLCLAMV